MKTSLIIFWKTWKNGSDLMNFVIFFFVKKIFVKLDFACSTHKFGSEFLQSFLIQKHYFSFNLYGRARSSGFFRGSGSFSLLT